MAPPNEEPLGTCNGAITKLICELEPFGKLALPLSLCLFLPIFVDFFISFLTVVSVSFGSKVLTVTVIVVHNIVHIRLDDIFKILYSWAKLDITC